MCFVWFQCGWCLSKLAENIYENFILVGSFAQFLAKFLFYFISFYFELPCTLASKNVESLILVLLPIPTTSHLKRAKYTYLHQGAFGQKSFLYPLFWKKKLGGTSVVPYPSLLDAPQNLYLHSRLETIYLAQHWSRPSKPKILPRSQLLAWASLPGRLGTCRWPLGGYVGDFPYSSHMWGFRLGYFANILNTSCCYQFWCSFFILLSQV